MKYVLEFGNKGGTLVDNLVFTNKSLAVKTAYSIAGVLDNSWPSDPNFFNLKNNESRKSWESPSHFVALSRISRVSHNNGPASAQLWYKKD